MEEKKVYNNVNEWLFDIESESESYPNIGKMRIERMYLEIGPLVNQNNYNILLRWIDSAFFVGMHKNVDQQKIEELTKQIETLQEKIAMLESYTKYSYPPIKVLAFN